MSDYADDTEISNAVNFGDDTNDSKTNGENESNHELDQETDHNDDHDDGESGFDRDNDKSMGKTSDDEDRKLFLGGLSWDTTEQDLRTYFSKYGTVSEVSIKYDAVTGNPRGFGFITFANESSLDTVLDDGPHMLRNKTIDPKRAKSRPICKKIFVGGVDANMTEDEIKKYFSKFGTVDGIELPFDRQRNRRREFCFIIFHKEEAAEAAVKESKQVIGNKECDIKRAQPQPVAQQQKRMQQQQQYGDGYTGYDMQGSRGRGRRSQTNQTQQSTDQWGYNGAQGYYQGYYGANQYPNAYGANAYPGYDYYGQYYGQYSDYWNYYGYGADGTTPDYTQAAALTEGTASTYGSGQNSQSSSHSHSHHSSGGASGGKMIRKSGSTSGYHPYRSTSGH